MAVKKKIPSLLPAGFKDMLPNTAEFEATIASHILAHTAGFGYQQVSPPVLEFETTLLAGKDDRLKHQTFRLMDPLSRQMIALRADMTIQVARIAATRLKSEPRPLRLSYAGNVFRVQGEGLYAERQLRQVGAELIGSNSPAADAEIVLVAAGALTQLGIKELSVDFSLPGLAPALLDAAALTKSQRRILLEKIERKDVAAIRKHADAGTVKQIEAVLRTAGEAKTTLAALQKIALPKAGAAMVTHLARIVELLAQHMPKLTVTIDPLERRGFEYHTGSTFSFFSASSREELGRGGRYFISGTEPQEEAVGFSLLVSTLQRNLTAPKASPRLYLPFGASLKVAEAWQKKGYATVQGLEATSNPKKEAARQACAFYLQSGKAART